MTKEENNKTLVLTELQRSFDKKMTASDILDGKLQNILTFLSVIVSVVPAIEATAFQTKFNISFWLIMCLVLVCYILAIDAIIKGMGPRTYHMPISNSWDELSQLYFHASGDGVLDLLISEHLTSMKIAGVENDKKAACLQKSSTLMIIIVLLLIIALPLSSILL
jgi:hypothetical protein